MKNYIVSYSFDGYGEVKVKAESEEEARDKFFEGEWSGKEDEWGQTYNIEMLAEKSK